MATAGPEKPTGVGVSLFCPKCKEILKDPRILPCLHSLCKHCIEKQLNGHFCCPVCEERSMNIKSRRDIENLPVDNLLRSVLDMVYLHGRQKIRCDVCDETDSSLGVCRCKECAQYLCDLHSEAHKRARNSKSHAIVSLDDLRKQSLKDLRRPLFCSRHVHELLCLFCETCDEPICRSCSAEGHLDHRCIQLEEAILKYGAEISSLLQQAKAFAQDIDRSIPRVETMAAEVNLKTKKILSEIDLIFDFQVTAFWKRKKELRDQVLEIRQSRISILKSQEESLKKTLKQLRHACKFTEVNLHSSRKHKEGTSLVLKHLLSSRLTQLMKKEAKHLEPLEESSLHFRADDTCLQEAIAKFGWLDSSYAYPPECVARGVGTKFASVAKPAKLVVVLNDREGRPLGRSGEPVSVEIVSEDGKKLSTDSIINKQNGTYEVTYTPKEVGRISLEVKVRRKRIKGSPFHVVVSSDLRTSWI